MVFSQVLRRRLLKSVLLVSSVVLFIFTLGKIMNEQRRAAQQKDLFLISAYFYKHSVSLGKNSLSVVWTGDYGMLDYPGKVKFRAWNMTTFIEVETKLIRITLHNVCRWISMFSTVQLLPNLDRLEISVGNGYARIPFSYPVRKKHDVVSCVAPLFANEQWQTALMAVQTYRKYGSHMHLYVRSTVAPLFKLLREYENKGSITIQPWLRIHLTTLPEEQFNPNINIEFRNQAAAQTDCLLKYKESATFITFVDLDDILFPRLGRTYLEEYQYMFNSIPNVAYLHYEKRNAHLVTTKLAKHFSLSDMFFSMEHQEEFETGKLVTMPAFMNFTWIHWPSDIPKGLRPYNVTAETNSIVHIKQLKRVAGNRNRRNINHFNSKLHSEDYKVVDPMDIDQIQDDFDRMMSIPRFRHLMKHMPTEFTYYNLISECYERTFYKFHDSTEEMKCPGPDRCDFPENPGIPCYNSVSHYDSLQGTELNIHFHARDNFREEDGCRH